ncbi:MAG: hypothetical protein JW789_03550 [Candidatus Aenigmarchaeota archaeon]|nr:hypothetical protein [Candidatus Aenigmarchaeota archaeon]
MCFYQRFRPRYPVLDHNGKIDYYSFPNSCLNCRYGEGNLQCHERMPLDYEEQKDAPVLKITYRKDSQAEEMSA